MNLLNAFHYLLAIYREWKQRRENELKRIREELSGINDKLDKINKGN